MKKIVKIFIFIISLALFSGIITIDINAQEQDAYMIVTNPGENASVEMRVSWHMKPNKSNGKIIYTTKADFNWENAITISPEKYLSSEAFHFEEFLHYNAVLSNLEPNTEYMYKVGQDTFSDIHYFKTAGSDSFNFILSGDWHSYTPLPGRTEAAMNVVKKAESVEENLDFFLSIGDVVANGSDYDAWEDLYNHEPFKKYMWVNTIGNHDVLNNVYGPNSDEYFAATHNFPKNGYETQEGKSYYFLYGNSLFIVLNNEDIDSTRPEKTARSVVQKWASDVIKNNPTQYIFVAMHYNWFSGITGNNYQYDNWKKFFDEHRVDLAMSGHNHVYVRTNRLFDDQYSADKGTVYLQIPSADNERGRDMNTQYSNADKIVKRWTEGAKTVGAVIVNVDPQGIKTRLLDRNGNIIDEAMIPSQRTITPVNKEVFRNSFSVHPSSVSSGDVIVTASTEGAGKIEKIEYYHENSLIGINYFVKISDFTYTINNAVNYEKIRAIIYYKDNTLEEVRLKNPGADFYKLEGILVLADESEFYLRWDYLGEKDLNAWVFINGIAFKEIDLKAGEVALNNAKITDHIEIRTSEYSLYGYYHSRYSINGDVNLDGEINNEDIYLIQQYLLGNKEIAEELVSHLDIDLDGKITLYDLTYISLFTNDYINSLSKESYTITYLDYFGNVILSEEVGLGETGTFPDLEVPEGYVLAGWDTNIKEVNQNLIVKAIIETSGDLHE